MAKIQLERYIFLTDVHWGYEYDKRRHKRAIHDPKALAAVLDFARDFKPDHIILGGDILDCGAISRHNKHKPGNIEGLRLGRDMAECRSALIQPLEALGALSYYYIIGNHEDWLNDVYIESPALEGLLDLDHSLLSSLWDIVPQGHGVELGKLYFMHGDTLKGGAEHVAKQAWLLNTRNVRFGHFHTYQVHTPKRALDADIMHTSMAIPCLCRRDPTYGDGAANAWMQGFNYGYVQRGTGYFSDYTPIITNGMFVAEGKQYGLLTKR